MELQQGRWWLNQQPSGNWIPSSLLYFSLCNLCWCLRARMVLSVCKAVCFCISNNSTSDGNNNALLLRGQWVSFFILSLSLARQTQRHQSLLSTTSFLIKRAKVEPRQSISLLLALPPENSSSFGDVQSLLWFFCRRCSNSSVESDDEPPCAEEIDYDTASSSDGEEEFLELDQEIQEYLSCVEGETEDEGVTTGQTCSSRALRGLYISSQPAPSSTALPLGSSALGLCRGFESSPVWARLWPAEQQENGSLLVFASLPASAPFPDVLLLVLNGELTVCLCNLYTYICWERLLTLCTWGRARGHQPRWYHVRSSFPKHNPQLHGCLMVSYRLA